VTQFKEVKITPQDRKMNSIVPSILGVGNELVRLRPCIQRDCRSVRNFDLVDDLAGLSKEQGLGRD